MDFMSLLICAMKPVKVKGMAEKVNRVWITDGIGLSAKKSSAYLRSKTSRKFLNALAKKLAVPVDSLVTIVRGRSAENPQGTWVHPVVAFHMVQSISPELAAELAVFGHDSALAEWARKN